MSMPTGSSPLRPKRIFAHGSPKGLPVYDISADAVKQAASQASPPHRRHRRAPSACLFANVQHPGFGFAHNGLPTNAMRKPVVQGRKKAWLPTQNAKGMAEREQQHAAQAAAVRQVTVTPPGEQARPTEAASSGLPSSISPPTASGSLEQQGGGGRGRQTDALDAALDELFESDDDERPTDTLVPSQSSICGRNLHSGTKPLPVTATRARTQAVMSLGPRLCNE